MSGRIPPLIEAALARSASRALAVYLDACREVDVIRRGKRLTFELLELAPGHRVLDLGCGTGEDVISLSARVGAAGRAVGVDADPWMIEEAHRRAPERRPHAEFRVANGERLPFDDAYFDGCRLERLLVHAAEPGRIVAELARVTRPGGRVVLAEPDMLTLIVSGATPALTARVWPALTGRFTQPDIGRNLPALLAAAGLRDIRVHGQTAVFQDHAAADRILTLSDGLAEAVASGTITPADAARWWQELESAAAAGRFFAALTGFAVVGRA